MSQAPERSALYTASSAWLSPRQRMQNGCGSLGEMFVLRIVAQLQKPVLISTDSRFAVVVRHQLVCYRVRSRITVDIFACTVYWLDAFKLVHSLFHLLRSYEGSLCVVS